jgi:hypothetical protein
LTYHSSQLKLIPELKLSVGQAIAENRYPDDYLKIVEEVERGKNGLKGGFEGVRLQVDNMEE